MQAMTDPIQPAPEGLDMPCLGLGTWLSQPGEAGTAVRWAVEHGYRLIDCASIYDNEDEIGATLREIFRSGPVSRDEIWITSKLWNDCHEPQHVRPACLRTLEDLGLESLDLYLVHFPVSFVHGIKEPTSATQMTTVPMEDTWAAMEALVDEGLVRHLGVSNFEVDDLTRLQRSASRMPEVNQFECHPLFSRSDLVDHCHRNDIAVTAHTSLGSPMNGMHEHPSLLANASVAEIGMAHQKAPAQVLLRWALQRGMSVIPKSVREDRMIQNSDLFDFELTAEDMVVLDGLNRSLRYNHPTTPWLGRSRFPGD